MLPYNPAIKVVLKLLEAENLPYGERSQVEALVREFGYWGARRYLDPSIDRCWHPHRDTVMVMKHYAILEGYEKDNRYA